MGRYWAKIAQISDFARKLQLGFIMQIGGDEGVAVDGDAEPSTASGGCSEAEHPQRSKKSSKRAARRFFRAPQGGKDCDLPRSEAQKVTLPSLKFEQAVTYPDGPSPATGEG